MENFLGTYLTENGSTAVVVSRSAMVVDGKKQVIWVGFIHTLDMGYSSFSVWNKEGKNLDLKLRSALDLKEAVREKAY